MTPLKEALLLYSPAHIRKSSTRRIPLKNIIIDLKLIFDWLPKKAFRRSRLLPTAEVYEIGLSSDGKEE